MFKYKTYIDDDGEEVEFTIFIIHGHSEEWRKVERYIKDVLNFNAIVLKESYTGRIIFDKFRDTVWEEVDCAVAIVSPDDKLDNDNYRARQNVLYELGYCQAVFDSFYEDEIEIEPVIIIKEDTIDFREVSDLLGVEVLVYNNKSIESIFHKLNIALNSIYNELKD